MVACHGSQQPTACAMAHLSNHLTNILTKPVHLWQFMLLLKNSQQHRPDVTLTQLQFMVSFNLPNSILKSKAESYGDQVSPCFRTL